MKSILRGFAPVAILIAVATLFCAYILVIDDYVADTGPIVDRFLGCLGVQLVALSVGSFIAARRAKVRSLEVGTLAGSLGAFILVGLLSLVSDEPGTVNNASAMFLIAGIMLSAIGSWMGTW